MFSYGQICYLLATYRGHKIEDIGETNLLDIDLP